MNNSLLPALLLLPMLSGAAAAGEDEELTRGGMLSASCAGCHGPDGRSPGAIPSIAGKDAEFIRTALEEFRSGQRPSTVMGRHAKGYTDEELALIADYFASRK
jgi:cytochrome subunit of sulfide dehydrogenase